MDNFIFHQYILMDPQLPLLCRSCTLKPDFRRAVKMSHTYTLKIYECVCIPHVLSGAVGIEKTRRGIRSYGTRVTGGCELPNMGARNQPWFLRKSNTCY